MQTRNFKLYLVVLGLLLFVVITAVGGGLFGQQEPCFLQWQHKLFFSLCHQMPSRSFWINGQPMAVCSRCFGIYSGFFGGWVLLPFLTWAQFKIPVTTNKLLLAMLALNVADVVGNLLGFWQNTLASRWALGELLGMAAAIFFRDVFFTKIITKQKEYYGRITSRVP